MSAASKVLDRVDRAKSTKPGNWVAGCPCCQSKQGRPLSIRELEDGRLLLHAFCGCDTQSVLAALGLTLSDLFDKPLGHRLAPAASRIPVIDLLGVIAEEAFVVAILASDVAEGNSLSPVDSERLLRAAARIGAAAKHAR